MPNLEEIKRILAEHKEKIRENYGVQIIGIFGSYARGEQTELSDIDILIELEKPIGLKFFELYDYFENILGTKVYILTLESLRQKSLLLESMKEDLIYV
uniref:Nucleotidyltransferase n=1 Tax=Thermodesulfobacterium geofontis TaxID=1295609 RepID=A0A7V5XGB4_9BACT